MTHLFTMYVQLLIIHPLSLLGTHVLKSIKYILDLRKILLILCSYFVNGRVRLHIPIGLIIICYVSRSIIYSYFLYFITRQFSLFSTEFGWIRYRHCCSYRMPVASSENIKLNSRNKPGDEKNTTRNQRRRWYLLY